MALYAFDGTGNKDKEKSGKDSNVLKFFEVYDKAYPSRVNKYVTGIGSGNVPVIRTFSKITGKGGKKKVKEGMKALEENLERGDTEIDIVGFSRGAAEALQFANGINNNEIAAQRGRAIRFLGLWDTVASFGNPKDGEEPNWDLDVPTNVESCYHATALDERRQFFPLIRQAELNAFATRQKGIHEVWFRGYHSDVGGGNENVGLSSIPLIWMFRRANGSGIRIPETLYADYLQLCNPGANPKKPRDPKEDKTRVIMGNDVVHISVFHIPEDPNRKKFQANNPPPGIRVVDHDGEIMQRRFRVA